tara:strand:- start:979 stop:1875 length:897 start_codon:yes stop_codon:yes gene_type:complete
MQLSQTDLNLFIVFEAIYREGNLTRAAEQLCLSQPAVSNALARLRRTFDDPLFIRSRQGMLPTPVAENIIGRVREALQLMSSSLTEGTVFQAGQSDKCFRINMSDLISAMILSPLVQAVSREAPAVHLESYHIPRGDLLRDLASGAVDLAIDAPVLSDPQLCHLPLLKERYVCMLRKGHPLAGDRLTLDDYLSLQHIHVSSRRTGPGYVEQALNNMGKSRDVHLRLQHYMIAPGVALASDLALTAPLRLVQAYDAQIYELPFALPELELHLYWHKSRDKDPANRWMRQLITDQAQDQV